MLMAGDHSRSLTLDGSSAQEAGLRRRQIEELCRAHQDFLRRLALQLCRSTSDAEDLLQDVLERTALHFHSPMPNHRAWMARVMRNLFVDRWRRHADSLPLAVLEDELPQPAADVPTWWECLGADDIRARLRELPDELRRPLELFAFERCSYAEIGKRLELPVKTVGTRILRARRRLKRSFLDSHGPQPPMRTGGRRQISVAYSRIARSEENRPARAVFRIEDRIQLAGERQAASTRRWQSR